jgi:hypothetical protein
MVETKAKMVRFWVMPGLPTSGAKEGLESVGEKVHDEDSRHERGQE